MIEELAAWAINNQKTRLHSINCLQFQKILTFGHYQKIQKFAKNTTNRSVVEKCGEAVGI